MRIELNNIEKKRLYKKLVQQRAGSLKRLIKLTNLWQHSLKKKGKRSSKITKEKEVTTDRRRI